MTDTEYMRQLRTPQEVAREYNLSLKEVKFLMSTKKVHCRNIGTGKRQHLRTTYKDVDDWYYGTGTD